MCVQSWTRTGVSHGARFIQIGPLIVHPLIYNFPHIFYGGLVQHSLLQKYVSKSSVLPFPNMQLGSSTLK